MGVDSMGAVDLVAAAGALAVAVVAVAVPEAAGRGETNQCPTRLIPQLERRMPVIWRSKARAQAALIG